MGRLREQSAKELADIRANGREVYERENEALREARKDALQVRGQGGRGAAGSREGWRDEKREGGSGGLSSSRLRVGGRVSNRVVSCLVVCGSCFFVRCNDECFSRWLRLAGWLTD